MKKSNQENPARMKLRERIARKTTKIKSERPARQLRVPPMAPLSVASQNRSLRSATQPEKKALLVVASKTAIPLGTLMGSTNGRYRNLRNNSDPDNDENVDPLTSDATEPSKLSPVRKLKIAAQKLAPTRPKGRSEKIPKSNKKKLEWLLQHRSSLSREAVLQAFPTTGAMEQFGTDCLDKMTQSLREDVQCQYLKLLEALLVMEHEELKIHYDFVQGLASPAMMDHIYATCLRFPDHIEIQQHALAILAVSYHLIHILRDTLQRHEENIIEAAIAPIVRAMENFPDDVIIQTLAVKVLYQYIYLPGRHVSGALVATPGCMEALAAAGQNQYILAAAPYCIRSTTNKIFRRLVVDMRDTMKPLRVNRRVGRTSKILFRHRVSLKSIDEHESGTSRSSSSPDNLMHRL